MSKHISITLTLPKTDFTEVMVVHKEEYETFFENHEDGDTSILIVDYTGVTRGIEEIKFKLSALYSIDQSNITHYTFDEKDTKYIRITIKGHFIETHFDLLSKYCYNMQLIGKMWCVKHFILGHGSGFLRRYKGNCIIRPTIATH